MVSKAADEGVLQTPEGFGRRGGENYGDEEQGGAEAGGRGLRRRQPEGEHQGGQPPDVEPAIEEGYAFCDRILRRRIQDVEAVLVLLGGDARFQETVQNKALL